MKKMIISYLFACIAVGAYAQMTDKKHRFDKVTIYDYGLPVTSCECNFENLSANWNIWIANHDDVAFLSYNYVETIKDSARIAYYANIMYAWEAVRLYSSAYSSLSGQEAELKIKAAFGTAKDEFYSQVPANLQDSLYSHLNFYMEDEKRRFIEEVNTGDKVFLLKFESNGREYDHFVVCRPGSNKILSSDPLSKLEVFWNLLKIWLNSKAYMMKPK